MIVLSLEPYLKPWTHEPWTPLRPALTQHDQLAAISSLRHLPLSLSPSYCSLFLLPGVAQRVYASLISERLQMQVQFLP